MEYIRQLLVPGLIYLIFDYCERSIKINYVCLFYFIFYKKAISQHNVYLPEMLKTPTPLLFPYYLDGIYYE